MAGSWDRWLVGVAVTLVVGGMGVASATRDEPDAREALREFIERERATAGGHHHEAPWGATTEGSAFAHYRRAEDDGRTAGLLGFEWRSTAGRGHRLGAAAELTVEQLAALRQRWQPIVLELENGAHARDRTPVGSSFSPFLQQVARAEADARWAEGRRTECVHLWLDLLTYCIDRGDGFATRQAIESWTDARLCQLDAAQRRELADALRRLDPRAAHAPDPGAVLACNVHLLDLVQSDPPMQWSLRRRLRAWRSGFDPVRQQLDSFLEIARRADAFAAPDLDAPGSQRHWREFLDTPLTSPTAPTEQIVAWLTYAEESQRHALADLRLLRLAIAFHDGQELRDLTDTFGGEPVECAVDGDACHLHSAGGASRTANRERK